MKILEQLSPCAEKLSRKVDKVEEVASDLAKVIGSEKVLIEECAELLHQAHDMQAMEASLRIHLMQLK
uniref:Uncharacterized protein n=1 Tax=Arundo donax TaxID=35708 RepID=A0A0A9GYG6_ARUDO